MKNIYIAVLFIFLIIVNFQNAYSQYYEWGKRGGGTGHEYANDCCIDPEGYIYIIGTFENSITIGSNTLTSAGLSDIFVAKYDTNGNAVWAFRAGGTGSDSGLCIAQDGYGNIGITGSFEGTANFNGTNLISYGKKDVFCAKYYSSGSLQWVYKSGGSLNDIGYGITFDQNGNVYVSGKFNYKGVFGTINFHDTLTSTGGSDIFIMKFDPFGVYLWSRRSGSISDDAAYGIAADYNYSCLITGIYNGKYFVEKYNTLGDFQWNTVINNSNYGEGQSICTDGYGNIYVSGLHMGTDYKFFISYSKLLTNGNIIWTKTSGGYSNVTKTEENYDAFINQENINNRGAYLVRPYNGTSNISRYPLLEYACYAASWARLDIWQWQPLVDSNKVLSVNINPSMSYLYVGPIENNNQYWWRISTSSGNSDTWSFYTRVFEDIGNKIIFTNGMVYLCGSFNSATGYFPPFEIWAGRPTSFIAQINPSNGEYNWIQKVNITINYGSSSGKSITAFGNNFYQTGIMWASVKIGPDALTSAGGWDFYLAKLNINKAITIINPEYNDKIQKNLNNLIKWKKYHIPNLILYYSSNNGIDWAQIGTSSSDSMYNWNTNVVPSTTARIKVVDGENTSIFDTTSNFTVCNLNLTYPVGSENLITTKSYNITWDVAFVNNLKIEYTTNNGINWLTVVNSTPAGTGSYLWTVPITVSGQCKIRLTDADYPNIISQSPNQFSIIPYIDLSSPNGGEIFQIGTVQNIKWLAKGSTVVNLTYTTNNGLSWASIMNNLPTQDSGNYNWTIPHTPSTQCKVRVTDAVFSQAFDTSNTTFTIANPNITVNSPNGGESLYSGSIQPVSWESYGVYKVKIELSTNGGITTIQPPIAFVNSNVGSNSTNWIVNNVSGANCKIKVTDSSNVQLFDVSNMPFSIVVSPITITQPNGGEVISAGINYNIIWSLTGFDFVKLEYTTDNCSSWNLIADNVAASAGTYNWLIPYNSSPNCRIKISNSVNPIQNKVSNNVFSITTVPLQPALISPLNGSEGNIAPLNFYWYKSISATSYRFQLSTDSSFNNIIVNDSNLVDSVKIVNNLLPLTLYYWRVSAKNNEGISNFSAVWSFKTLGYPNSVTLITPQNNILNQPTSMNFTWNMPNEQMTKLNKYSLSKEENESLLNLYSINKFWFEYSTDSNFTSISGRDTTLTDTTITIAGLNNLTKYYWRVKAKNQVGWGEFSSVWNFTTIVPLPSVPVLTLPANNSIDITLTPLLDWSDVQYASSYRVQISTNSGFTTTVLDTSGIIPSQFTVPSGKLSTLTTYYWRVNATNINGTSSYSTIWNFTTIPALPSAPLLSQPSNNVVNQPTTLTFKWYKSLETLDFISKEKNKINIDGALPDEIPDEYTISKYWFEYSSDSTFNTIAGRDTTLTDTIKTISGLNNLTKYYWRVKAKNQVGWGEFSSVWNFTTIVPLPSAPVLSLPANNSIDISLTPLIDWNDVQYASSYRLQVSTNSGFTTTVLDTSGIIPSQFTVPSGKLSTLTTYYWRVNATNISGTSSYSTVWNFTTIPSLPSAPLLSQPVNNAVNQLTTLTFKWYKSLETLDFISKEKNKINISGAISDEIPDEYSISKYWFEYSTDSTFNTIAGRDTTLTDTAKTIAGLNNLTKYYWRVKAKNQIGWSVFSSIWNFTTIVPLPIAPVLISPANNSTGISLTPLLDWNDVQYAVSYRIQISADSLFGTTLWDTSSVSQSQVIVPSNKLTGLTKYYWRVNATNITGTGLWSAVWNFRTLQNLSVSLKVYLEGFWDGSSQVVDTAKIYLANSTSPYSFADSSVVVLSSAGTANPSFTKTANGNYYIVVVHRNHLETWSKLPQSFVTGTPVNYDFTTAADKAYGDNMKLSYGAWVLYAGDANQDGAVDALDVGIFITQFGNLGYLSCDFNGDGSVDALDVMIFIGDFGVTKAMPTLDNKPFDPRTKEQIIEEIKNKFGYFLKKESNS